MYKEEIDRFKGYINELSKENELLKKINDSKKSNP